MGLLGYSNWQNMREVLDRAQAACSNSGHESSDHFTDASKMVGIGSKASREVQDINLSRYACYLTAMNGDPRKPEIAQAQTYFAIKTREAELSSSTPALSAPLLISARLIGESTGQSRNAAINQLKRHSDIKPVAHFIEPLRHLPSYLYPLAEVEAYFTGRGWELSAPFQPFTGKVLPGLPKKKALPRAKAAAPAQQPLFFDEVERLGAEFGAALARRLTEAFIRDELPQRIQAEMTRRVSA